MMIDKELLYRLGYDDLEAAGTDLITLEVMGAISDCREVIEGLKTTYASFEALEQKYNVEGEENFEADDHYLEWRAAREQMEYWQQQLERLKSHAF